MSNDQNSVDLAEMISALYAGFYDRAPEESGLQWWENEGGLDLNDPDSFKKLAIGFAQHPAFADKYAGMSDEDFVQAIYENVSGYAGDEAGVEFWTQKLQEMQGDADARAKVASDMIYGFINSQIDAEHFPGLSQEEIEWAQKRQEAVRNKAEAGLDYVKTLGDDSDFSPGVDLSDPAALMKDPAWKMAQLAIEGVDEDSQTLAAAEERIEELAQVHEKFEESGDLEGWKETLEKISAAALPDMEKMLHDALEPSARSASDESDSLSKKAQEKAKSYIDDDDDGDGDGTGDDDDVTLMGQHEGHDAGDHGLF